ncbi:protein arginine N-methyltransferase 1, putative [Plasmodium relictum]|uniref:type I protein arginine methyltransferase n=1 Tax=Plasmodium relictum TaxID=85471 RepID=A0A1J1HD94_PLARL|nr:protein arginine N-methyltransferase 1, putative [Plasmodium relictum]CRH03892.1 protein arginine N-methyltransferase 1, putative [Plasmodium relictum]
MTNKYNKINKNNYETREAVYYNEGNKNDCDKEKDIKYFNEKELKSFFDEWQQFYKEKLNDGERKNFIMLDEEKNVENGNNEYFNSYNYIHIHEDMIKDEVRTRTYYDAMRKNEHLIKDKIVLDVGSGTGILSFFAAKCGAKHVYSIEKSDIVYTALKIRDENNLTDKITFIKGLAEQIELPVNKVDIIISEWMGYCLLYENMLDTVLYCRDKWLKKGGLIFPDKAFMYIAGIEDSIYREEKFDFWKNCYDLNFSSVLPILKEEVVIDYVDKNFVVTDTCRILTLDLNTCTKEELSFVSPFKLKMIRKDYIHALVIWFDVCFSACHTEVSFTTGPFGSHTHWKQIVLYTDNIITAEKNEILRGIFALKKNKKNNRHLDMKLHYIFDGIHTKAKSIQYFNIS